VKKTLVGIQTDDGKVVARQGYRIFQNAVEAGVVTSGTFAPSLQRPIAMAYLAGAKKPVAGESVEVEVRARKVRATIVPRPFYRQPPPFQASAAHV
jgi:aminomethyltransferase